MLKLNKLVFQNIGRFVKPQEVDFDSLGNLIQVEGQNNNTGGSSGAAKSTFFKAIEFLLGLNNVSNSILQSRYTKESINVVGFFDFDGLPLKIERGKKLLIDLNGEVTTGSSKLTEEKLDQILGMPRELFRKMLYKRQKEPAFFLNLTPAESHAFLTSCLGLETEQAKILKLEERLKILLEQESSFKTAIESNKAAMEATQSAILSLGPSPVLEMNSEFIKELESKLIVVNNEIKQTKILHQKELEDIEKTRPIPVSTPFDRSGIEFLEKEISFLFDQYTKLEDVEKERCNNIKVEIAGLQNLASKLQENEHTRQNNIKSEIFKLQNLIRELEKTEQLRQNTIQSNLTSLRMSILDRKTNIEDGNRAKIAATQLAQELQKIRSSMCPTCNQSWINDAAKAKETEILNKLQDLKKVVITGIEAGKELLKLEEESKRLIVELTPASLLEINENDSKIKRLTLDSQPRNIPEVEEIKKQIHAKQNDAFPRSIPKAIELRLKRDFKVEELKVCRQQEKTHQIKEDQRNQELASQYATKCSQMRVTHQIKLEEVLSQEKLIKLELQEINTRIRSYEESKKRYDDNLNKLNIQLSGISGTLDAKNTELSLVQEEVELATLAKLAIKSYLSCSFESALESISDEATRMIRQIPNMATASIQFEGLRNTKDGKVKEEITCLLSMDGEIGVPIKSLSGGEGSSADLAVDLSVVKFISEQTGKGINIMLLDEISGGMDTVCIQDTIEMLKGFSVDKKLLIVEHNPVAVQSFENKITVIRDGLTSKIVQQ